jgi:hypothetical protein
MRALPTLTAVIGLGAAAASFTSAARAADWSIGFGIGLPGVVVVAPAPEYVPPPPRYYEPPYHPPAYYVPGYYAPGYYRPPVVGYYRYPDYDRHHDRHHRDEDDDDD